MKDWAYAMAESAVAECLSAEVIHPHLAAHAVEACAFGLIGEHAPIPKGMFEKNEIEGQGFRRWHLEAASICVAHLIKARIVHKTAAKEAFRAVSRMFAGGSLGIAGVRDEQIADIRHLRPQTLASELLEEIEDDA